MKYWKEIVIGILVIAVIALCLSTSCERRKKNIAENNVIALTDSLRTYQLQNGELLTAKHTLILEKKELEKYLEISDKEKKDIEKKLKSSLVYITKLEANIRIDTLRLIDSVYIENENKKILFTYNDHWVDLEGITTLFDSNTAETVLNRLNMGVPLKVGLTENNQFFASTSNPYLSISDIEGAEIITRKTKEKRWGIGPYLGVGIGYGGVLNNNGFNSGFVMGATLGIAIHYNLFQW
jgi:hypothetical protein